MNQQEQAAFDRLTRENERLAAEIAALKAEVARLKKFEPKGGGGPGEER